MKTHTVQFAQLVLSAPAFAAQTKGARSPKCNHSPAVVLRRRVRDALAAVRRYPYCGRKEFYLNEALKVYVDAWFGAAED